MSNNYYEAENAVLLIAAKERLGATNLEAVQFNDDWKKFRMQFQVNKSIIGHLSTILFNSECMAKLVMDSPIKPIIYGVATKFRNKDEQCVNDELKRGNR